MCHVTACNRFAKKKKKAGLGTLRQGNLDDKLAATFDKVVNVQQTAADYQQHTYFHFPYQMNLNTVS